MISDGVKEQLHIKIVNLEREIRETEILIQQKRANLQRMAEVISSNVNRAIIDTLSKHRLGDTMLMMLRK